MRILHVPYCYYPDAVGGTEIYVAGIAQWQQVNGNDVGIAAPSEKSAVYESSGLPVWRFPVSPVGDLRELYGEGDAPAALQFARVLDEFNPDLVHIHALTRAVSLLSAAEAKERGIPVVFHYHTPTVSCSRGTLLRGGTAICEGRLNQRVCASCVLEAHGVSRVIAGPLSMIPASAGSLLGRAGLSGGWATAVRMPELIGLRARKWRELMELVDRIIAPCGWVRQLLIRNGLPPSKIILSRQGIEYDISSITHPKLPKVPGAPTRLASLGRLDPTKGLHVILEGLALIPDLNARLDVFCVRQAGIGDSHADRIASLARSDSRVTILPPVEYARVIPLLHNYDALVVPSQLLETGPLVVLEAFAAGTPVLGSRLGGIAELVTIGVDGMLVDPPTSPSAWAEALRKICLNPELLLTMESNIQKPKHVSQAADEIHAVYEDVLRQRLVSAAF